MAVALSVTAVLALAITTGLGIHVIFRPKHVVPDLDEVEFRNLEWTFGPPGGE